MLRIFDELSRDPFFSGPFRQSFQELMPRMNTDIETAPINIYGNDDAVRIVASVPGWQADWFDLSVEGNKLHLKGETVAPDDSNEKPRSISRVVRLPFRAQADHVEASYKNGILIIDLVKSEQDRPRKIQIQAA